MNVNFEAIEKTWFKPKNKILFTKEELELLEDVFSLAIGECPSEDIKKIDELEQKIKTYSGAWFKPKKDKKYVLEKLEEFLDKEYKYYSQFSFNTHAEFDDEEQVNRFWQEYGEKEMLFCIINKIQELKKEVNNGRIF